MTHVLYATYLQQGGGSALGLPVLLFQILAIGVVFYFLIIRPQGQARKKHAEMLSALQKGDDVLTAGGIVGIVKDIKDKDGETRVMVESGTATVVVERSRIVRVGGVTAPGTSQA